MNRDGLNLMKERFGQDTLLALGTINSDYPAIRYVNAYYEDGAFFVITYALSNKMRQIAQNPNVSVCAEWFAATGKARSLGYFGREENRALAARLREVFASWIDNGHNNFEDENTIILKIELENAVLFSHGTKYEISFQANPA